MLNDPTPQRLREVVERIVRQRLDQGQLREAPITQAQLETVKEQFTRVLAGMYHSRVDYPAAAGGITAEFGAQDTRSGEIRNVTPPVPPDGAPTPPAATPAPPPAVTPAKSR